MKYRFRSSDKLSPPNASLPGPGDITRVEYPNGLVLLTRSNFNSPSVVINGYVTVGSLFDSDEKLGLAYFTALSLMRGTHQRDFQSIYDSLESVGASLGFGAGAHTTGFNGRALAEDLPLLLGLLNEVLEQPSFPNDQEERLRAQILTGLGIRAQDTGEMASLTFDSILFKDHPYRRPEDGFPETIQAIRREDLVDFHTHYYGPAHMILTIVGAVSPSQVIDEVQKTLGNWQNPDQPEPPGLPPYQPMVEAVRKHVPLAGKSQTDLVIGVAGPNRKSPDYIAASLGNNILGQFGMYGRIGDVVREQSGLAYYAYTSLNAGIGPGTWEVSAGVHPANLEKTIQLIMGEVSRFIREPVSVEELSDSQENYIGRLPLSLESNSGMASAILNLERFSLGLDYYQRYADNIRRVSPEDVLETARRYFKLDLMAIASAGPET